MTVKINAKNDYSFLTTPDKDLKELLYHGFRKRDKGYFHNQAYQSRKWDGYVNFFNKENGKFLTGLLPDIEWALRKLNKEYHVEDERTPVNFLYDQIDKHFINKVALHDYQVDLINSVIRNHRGIIQAPTSAGKTFILIGIIKALPPNTPILVLQNRKSLALQNYQALVDAGIENVGQLWGGCKVKPNYITCATMQSVKKLNKIFPKIKAILVDEIHENMNKTAKSLYRKVTNAEIRVAISATPFKFGGKDHVQKFYTKGFFGPILRTNTVEGGILTTKYLQDQERLSKSKCTIYPIDKPQLPYETYQDAVKLGIEQSIHFHETVQKLANSLKGRTLILVERIEQGTILSKMLPNAFWIQGEDNDENRQKAFTAMKKAKKAIAIVSQGIITAGINVFVHNLINAAGGNAEHTIIQRLGRGLRTAKDKEILNYYDFLFNINDYLYEHSLNRIKVITKEGHDIEIKDDIDF